MGIGYSDSDQPPPLAAKVILVAEASYEMLNPNGWHYVKPLTDECYSVMITGEPYIKNPSIERANLRPLEDEDKKQLLIKFQELLSPSP